MFFKIFLSYFLGYIDVKIEGYYIERFINICKKEKIKIWNIKKVENINLCFRCEARDYRKISKIAKKIKCKTKMKNKKGVPFLLNKYKKRKIFLILLIIMIITIGVSTMFVWNVEITEKNGLELENIEKDLQNLGLKTGIMKKNINTQNIINQIRLNRTDIAWIAIDISGTNAIVKIVKTDKKPTIINEDEYCNIISEKNGIITKINAQSGTLNVKVGDTVNTGDILVKRLDGGEIYRD